MVVCLRKIHGLNKLKLIDASWIWTEPHSMRLKIKLTLQKEIMNGAIVQQSTLVEFVIRNQQCKHCEASFATGAWHAIVQVRQRVSHKRTFYYLEQLILKHDAHNECIKIMVSTFVVVFLTFLSSNSISLSYLFRLSKMVLIFILKKRIKHYVLLIFYMILFQPK